MKTPTIKQASPSEPSRHYMNRTLVECSNSWYSKKALIQFNVVGELNNFDIDRLNDISLVFTTVEACKSGYHYCNDPTITVALQTFDVDSSGYVTNTKVIDSIVTPDVNMTGHRFRITFPDRRPLSLCLSAFNSDQAVVFKSGKAVRRIEPAGFAFFLTKEWQLQVPYHEIPKQTVESVGAYLSAANQELLDTKYTYVLKTQWAQLLADGKNTDFLTDETEIETKDAPKQTKVSSKVCLGLVRDFVAKNENAYDLLDVCDSDDIAQIKANYKRIVLLLHPDKAGHTRVPEDLEKYVTKYRLRNMCDEERKQQFILLQDAFTILSDPQLRHEYDCSLPFDETIPTREEAKAAKDFFLLFMPIFELNASHAAPHLLDDAESREEKRWMERENLKVQRKLVKKELLRIQKLVDLAQALREREEEEARQRNEIELSQNRERFEKQIVKKLRQHIRAIGTKIPNGVEISQHFDRLSELEYSFVKQACEEIYSLLGHGTVIEGSDESLQFVKRMDAVVKAANIDNAEPFEDTLRRVASRISPPVVAPVQETQTNKTNNEQEQAPATWSAEELSRLSKAVEMHVAGVSDRWSLIAKHVKTKTSAQCIQMAREIAAGKRADGNMPAVNVTNGAHADMWTPEQQSEFEAALAKYPSSLDPATRWRMIAAEVQGKTPKECLSRFKMIKATIAAAAAKNQISESAIMGCYMPYDFYIALYSILRVHCDIESRRSCGIFAYNWRKMRVGSNTRVVVKNLPLSLDEAGVQRLISQKCKDIGLEPTDCKLLTKRARTGTKGKLATSKNTDTSRGLCFVGFADEKGANKFKDYYDGTYFRSCKVTIEYSRPPPKEVTDTEEGQKKPERVVDKSQYESADGEITTTLVRQVRKYTKAGVAGERRHTIFEDERSPGDVLEENVPCQIDSDSGEVESSDPGNLDRVILFNLPYNVTEAAIRELCRPFGPITDIHLPLNSQDDENSTGDKLTKGYCYVTWVFPSDAIKFRDAKNRSIFCGRIIHVNLAKPKKIINTENSLSYDILSRRISRKNTEKSSYKRELQKKKLAEAGNANIWNTLHIDINATITAVSRQLELEKKKILDEKDAAVNVALTETLVLNELTKWLDEQGINYQQYQISKSGPTNEDGDDNGNVDDKGVYQVHRSDDTIIIKNLPVDTAETDLVEMFSNYGRLMRLAVSPYTVMGVVQFIESKAAKAAFRNLAYKPYGGLPMYLEWAPVKLFHGDAPLKELPSKKQMEPQLLDTRVSETPRAVEPEEETEDVAPTNVSVYLKNLNFKTRNDTLKNHFGGCKGYVSSKVVMKDNDTLSKGFGFVEFDSLANAKAAIRAKTGLLIDGKLIEMSIAKRTDKPVAEIADNKLLKATTKIIVKNLAFQATKQDLYKMFSFYGNVNSTVQDVSAAGIATRTSQDASAVGHMGMPNTHPPVAANKTFFASVLEWIYGGEQVTFHKVNETLQLVVTTFINIHRKKAVPTPYIEIQKSVPLYAADQERSLLHFVLTGGSSNDPVQVNSAKLKLKRVHNGTDYALECPNSSIKVQRVHPPDGEGKEEPQVIGKPVTADASGEQVTCDISSIFAEAAGSINYRDFWLMLESEPLCYFSFDASPSATNVTLETVRTVKEERPPQTQSLVGPIAIVSIFVIGGAAYLFRNKRTDYTYFQDQDATVLIEDISNLLNDADLSVRAEALASFASSAHLFMFHVLLSRAMYPESSVARDAFADLACALSLVQHAAANMDASDCRGKNGVASISELVHSVTRSPVANALRVIMMELAVLAQLGVLPSKSDKTKNVMDAVDASENHAYSSTSAREVTKNGEMTDNMRAVRRYDIDDWCPVVRADREVMMQLEYWSATATRMVRSCMFAATKSNTPSTLARSLLAAEVATTLVSHYPHQYFHALIPPLVATHTHLFRTVGAYENLIHRVFTSQIAQPFHTELVSILNEAGYRCDLVEMYKRAHVAASGNRCYVFGGEGQVREDDAVDLVAMIHENWDPETRLQLALQKPENKLDAAQLQEFKAAQIFESDRISIKYLHLSGNIFGNANSMMRLAPPKELVEEPALELECTPNIKYTMPVNTMAIVPTRCETICERHQLYTTLVATQMMDTAISYTWHLRRAVIAGNRPSRFDAFSRALLNKLFLGMTLALGTQRSMLSALVDHMAQMVMISCSPTETQGGSQSRARHQRSAMYSPALTDARTVGVAELLAQIASDHRTDPLEKLLEYLGELLMAKASIELARELVLQDKDHSPSSCVKTEDITEAPENTSEVEVVTSARLSYGDMVELVLNKLYAPGLLKVVDVRDAYVLQICKFVLNLSVVPLSLVDQINAWVADPVSRRLAFSLTSNILKRSQFTDLKRRVLLLFLRFVVSDDLEIRGLFLRLISSPKGLYHANVEGRRYSVPERESVHDALVSWIRAGGGCSECKLGPYLTKDVVVQCETMVGRPLWQWPLGLINEISSAHKAMATQNGVECKGCDWQGFLEQINAPPKLPDEEVDWSLLSSVWLEELFALMALPNSVNAHPFITQLVSEVLQDIQDTDTVQPLLVAAGKNPALVPFVCGFADKLREDVAKAARQSCCAHISELKQVLKHIRGSDEFLVNLMGDVRMMWLDPRYKLLEVWQQEPSHPKGLVEVCVKQIGTCEEYVLQLSPFLSVEQLELLVTHLFNNSTEDALKRVLSLLMSVPHTFRREQKELNLALPQHFMYQCYNVKPFKELLKKQTGLLDYCVDCCVSGQMTVEAALSACTLIVESSENVSFVFGRVLCQLVQKVPNTRSVIVQAILPTLFQRNAWVDKMLWRGVVICMTTLWPGHKEQLCRLLLLLPPEHGESTIKTLQTQHNVIAFLESTLPQLDHTVHIPAYIKMMLSL
ncbi:putative RNA-binding protein 19 [Babesia sp. Xinjiang]|uniref:putative RNA-binding protein 19 n=1 Tax=Babesia sp. Xinjiang TaxID=462227 RepID=UPI000A22CD66|nr:putative RNA-binding protein 19 [Babesia sp. Xinjiang]ORM41443.1 putative RNA-binding protein 19 [Babesia sp. Xinjiang]